MTGLEQKLWSTLAFSAGRFFCILGRKRRDWGKSPHRDRRRLYGERIIGAYQ